MPVNTHLILSLFLYYIMKKLYYPINNIAHELRTPLTNIYGYAEYIQKAKLTEEDKFESTNVKSHLNALTGFSLQAAQC